MVALDPVAVMNFTTSRRVFDGWYSGPESDREAWWVRLVAALWTESGCKILAHTGTWGGGGWINDAQKAVLRTSAQYPHDGFGSNGGSVGALQQIPTPVARLATDQVTGKSKAWDGWGTIPDCMALETSIPKFLAQLRVTSNKFYGSKPMADLMPGAEIVADLLRVQQPLESEVNANYGGPIVVAAQQIAGMFPLSQEKDWFMANNWDEAKAEVDKEFSDLKNYMVSGDVMTAQSKSIFAFDTGQGSSFAAQLAEIMRLLQSIDSKLSR